MTRQIEFIFDFASPNAYLAHKALAGVAARTGADIVITPCLLGGIFKATGNKAPMITFAGVPARLAYENLEFERFIALHGLTDFHMNPHFPVNSLILMRGAVAAEQGGFLGPYVEAGLKAMWEDGLKLDDPEVCTAMWNAAGFDAQTLFAATQDPAIKQRLADDTAAAVARGVFGIPTFFVGEEMFFGKERLGQVEEAIRAAG